MKKAGGPGRTFFAPGIVMAFTLLGWCPPALALNPSLDVSQYAHTSWKIRDGFTKGQILSIAQTPDGYLWLATEFGLLRFDGLRNVPWQPPAAGQQLPSSFILSLLTARDGTLWIGTLKGLASWKDGKLTRYSELDGKDAFNLLEDHEGVIWVSGRSVTTGKLCAIRNGNVLCYADDGTLGRGACSLFEDRKGNLWAGVKDGLWRWKPGTPRFFPLAGEPDGIQGLGEDEDGALLVGLNGGIQRFIDAKTETHPLPGVAGQFRTTRLLRDRDGGLWIGTNDRGIVHVHQGRTDVFALSDGLSGELVYALFEDREGNIWVATPGGLDRFRDFAVATLTVNQGLSSGAVNSVLAAADGAVWLSSFGGLNKWNNGTMTVYRERSEPAMKGVHEIVASGLPGKGVGSLFQDSRGRIWVATSRGIGYFENDRFIFVSGIPGGNTLSISEDKAGNLWVANEGFGLFQLIGGSEVRHIPWTSLGHRDHASTLAADPLRGGLWLGFHLGGIAYFTDGQVRASYNAADGLGGGRVNQLQVDREGTLWAATEGGLSRLRNGRFATLTSKSGLPCDAIHWATEDNAHAFWLYTTCGLVHIASSVLDAWTAAVDKDGEAKPTIEATVFDRADGVKILSGATHYSPQVAKSPDGRLWFLPWDGVSVVDPAHLPFNRLPPPVHVEQITADRKSYDATSDELGRLQLPSLIRDLQINYTALSLVAPERILFRYMLEGRDSDWQEAGDRRQAFYTDLPPGDYRFRVMACNNSGVWNEAGTFLDFNIAPAYYQTTWFRVSVLAVFLIVLGTLYQLRLQQVARHVRGRMEDRLKERERIARDLHDTLLQGVQGLILKFDAVVKRIRRDDPAYDDLVKTLDRADQIMAEGRDRVRNLRVDSETLSDLPAAFQRVAEEILQVRKATLKTVIEGGVRELHPMVLHESYSIGREALINAFTHSDGQHVEVEITYDSRQFRVRVRDDGRGIDPEIVEDGGRAGHWGLQGMRERAQKIGAQLKFWSGAETGTEIELTVPGATAYKTTGDKSKSSWFSRISRR